MIRMKMRLFRSFKRVLIVLKSVYLRLKKPALQRITVIAFGENEAGGDGTGGFEIKAKAF